MRLRSQDGGRHMARSWSIDVRGRGQYKKSQVIEFPSDSYDQVAVKLPSMVTSEARGSSNEIAQILKTIDDLK